MEVTNITKAAELIRNNIEQVIVGKSNEINLILTSLFAGGHMLLEDVPGTGKTMLAKALAKSIDAEFKRIQFTPDLLPSDVTGLNFFNQKKQEFTFRKGPVFSNIILADEINRATPRTQSSLLECMEEQQVTVDGDTYALAAPFFVIATQNPIETAGTFPLPEAQLDRFCMKISIGYPTLNQELKMLELYKADNPLYGLIPVCTGSYIQTAAKEIQQVYVHPDVSEYLLTIITATRNHPNITIGASPRASITFLHCLQAYAAVMGRNYVLPEDIKYLAPFVLSHRICIRLGFEEASSPETYIHEILSEITVPTENFPFTQNT